MTNSILNKSEQENLRSATDHIKTAFEIVIQMIDEYERQHGLTGQSQRTKIFRIARSKKETNVKKIEKISAIMKSYVTICGLDDLRNEIMYLRENMERFARDGRFQTGDFKRFREEFYEVLSEIFIADIETGRIVPP